MSHDRPEPARVVGTRMWALLIMASPHSVRPAGLRCSHHPGGRSPSRDGVSGWPGD
jgi:hypothetical protein